jgi:hypothetical protein
MATASLLSIDVNVVTHPAVVPDDDVARLMYYLHCVTVGVRLFILDNDLIDYTNYWRLSPARRARVFETALQLRPDEFMDKVIFRCDDNEFTESNSFCEISVACDIVSVQQNVIIAGQAQDVSHIMLFKSQWLDYYYTRPIERAILRTTHHCSHCLGGNGLCTCDRCPRRYNSQCQPRMNLIDSPRNKAISSRASHSTLPGSLPVVLAPRTSSPATTVTPRP